MNYLGILKTYANRMLETALGLTDEEGRPNAASCKCADPGVLLALLKLEAYRAGVPDAAADPICGRGSGCE